MLQLIFTTDFFFSILRITAPILFATLGAVVGEKAGVSNIGLEGTMMVAALFGSLTTYWSGSWAVGLVVALFCGVLVSLLMGFFAFNLKTDIILTGIAVNMIGSGGTLFLVKVITQQTEGKALASTNSLITAALLEYPPHQGYPGAGAHPLRALHPDLCCLPAGVPHLGAALPHAPGPEHPQRG